MATTPATGPLTCTIQRDDGMTPGTLHNAALKRISALRWALTEIGGGRAKVAAARAQRALDEDDAGGATCNPST